MKNKIVLFSTLLLGLALMSFQEAETTEVDVCVYGGTSAGVIAAYTATVSGKSVLLIEPGTHLGGMSSGGLGYTDVGNKYVVKGLAIDFYRQLGKHYRKRFEEWIFEPSVAENIFKDYIEKGNVNVLYNYRLHDVTKSGNTITEITIENSKTPATATNKNIKAKVFIDCSYEGDLMAKSGASYFVGREANSVYGESVNGVQYGGGHQFSVDVDPYVVPGDPSSGLIWGINPGNLAANGTGDNKVQAYNFRVCLTNDPENRVPITEPDNYDRSKYELLIRMKAKKPWTGAGDVFIWSSMPNQKTDINNSGGFSSDMIGMNWEYPDANYERRAEIWKAHEDYTKGLFYFIGHDVSVPENIRNNMLAWGYPKDEYTDNNNWSHQLYIREARRMQGELVMTQKHCTGSQVANDPVGWAAYTMDSHNCDRLVVNGVVKNEGNVEVGGFPPFPISYRAIVPKRQEVSNLIVPVCLSASHIAYGSIRMEPVFMVLAQSSAVAACIAVDENIAVQDVDVAKLQEILQTNPLADGSTAEILIDNNDPTRVAVTGSWTLKSGGYGLNYLSDESNGSPLKTVRYTPNIISEEDYEIYAHALSLSTLSTNTTFTISDGTTVTERKMNKSEISTGGQIGGAWVKLGAFHLKEGTNAYVEISNKDADGTVVADAILFLPVEMPVTVTARAKNGIISHGEDAYVNFTFTGIPPWNLTYKAGNQVKTLSDIRENSLFVKVEIPEGEDGIGVIPLQVSNASEPNGAVFGIAKIAYIDKNIAASFDTYVHQANPATTYMTSAILELKTGDNYNRETFISFNTNKLTGEEGYIVLRVHYDDLVYSGTYLAESHLIEVSANTNTYTSFSWTNRPFDFTPVSETWVDASEKGSFIEMDVTDWVKQQVAEGKSQFTFRLKITYGGVGLLRFPSMESTSPNKPALLTAKEVVITGIPTKTVKKEIEIFPNPFSDYLKINCPSKTDVYIFSMTGNCVCKKSGVGEYTLNTGSLPSGVYLIYCQSETSNYVGKIIK
jgi:ribulose 1,5-bisphosphate synthetase/thiazole synthase